MAGEFAVDTFFTLSAFLGAFLLLQHLDKSSAPINGEVMGMRRCGILGSKAAGSTIW
jgi:hypothetical protein